MLLCHLVALTSGEITEIGSRSAKIHVPIMTLSSPSRCFSPEESPSEVGATIAKLTHHPRGCPPEKPQQR
jgi:hypothetical protein